MVITRGSAPATGFEDTRGVIAAGTQEFTNTAESAATACQQIQELYDASQSLGSTLNLNETLSIMAVRLNRLLPYDAIAVYVKRGQNLVPEFVSGENQKLFSSLCIPCGEGLSGWVADNSKPIMNGNPSVEAGYLNDPSKFSTLRAALAVPLETANGVVGVVALYRNERDAFSAANLKVLMSIRGKIALTVERFAGKTASMASAANDLLTGLPNARALFLTLESELAICCAAKTALGVVLCDLDGFRQISDRFGNEERNRILRYVANGIRQHAMPYETIARIGDYEFAVLVPGVTRESLDDRMEELRRIALDAGRLTPKPCRLSCSAGAALFPADGQNPETLLSQAGARLQAAQLTDRLILDSSLTELHRASPATAVIQ